MTDPIAGSLGPACPACGNRTSAVKDSRPVLTDNSTRRRRVCTNCDARFTTYEHHEKREPKLSPITIRNAILRLDAAADEIDTLRSFLVEQILADQ